MQGCKTTASNETIESAIDSIRSIFSTKLNTAGLKTTALTVNTIDEYAIEYRSQKTDCKLYFEDITLITQTVPDRREREWETVRIYLNADVARVSSAIPPNSPFGLGQRYLQLPNRPIGTVQKLKQSLAKLSTVRAASAPNTTESPKPDSKQSANSTTKTPNASSVNKKVDSTTPEQIESKLKTLKRWHEQGLIDQEEYQRKKAELLKTL